MLDRFFNKKVHQQIQFIGVLALSIGLPWSKIPLSLGTILLSLNVVLSWNWKSIFSIWINNRAIQLFLGLIFIELLSLLWSQNLSYGLNDLRQKLPFYAIPLCISAIQISAKQWKYIAYGFLISLFVIVSINLSYYFQLIGNTYYTNFREISIFVSHIRFSIIVISAVALLFIYKPKKLRKQLAAYLYIAYLLFYTLISQVFTGYICFTLVFLFLIFYFVFQIKSVYKRRFSLASLFFLVNIVLIFSYQFFQPIPRKEKFVVSNSKTAQGNRYLFEETDLWENGYHVHSWICEPELKKSWNNRSVISYFEKDKSGEQLRFTLWRFLTSKGQKKDASSVNSLSKAEITAIENGISSVVLMQGGLFSRIYSFRNQYDEKNPNGKTGRQRIIHLNIGIEIVKENLLFGVGAGDVADEFKFRFDSNNHGLKPDFQHRTHNQFLTFFISSGILSFLFFSSLVMLGFYISIKNKNPFLGSLFVIILCSCCIEDTFETQVGATFGAFVFALLFKENSLFHKHPSEKNNSDTN